MRRGVGDRHVRIGALLLALVAGGCGASSLTGPGIPSPSVFGGTAPPSTGAPQADTSAPPASAGTPLVTGGPPHADLAVDGGDPVAGQVGTFVWANGGSDSPWLPGAPIRATTGEALRVTLRPDTVVSGWRAVIAPAASAGGLGARGIGQGPAPIAIAVPGSGSWTLAITVAFGDLGSATYFWRLEVP
jgi:hypothetical protein